MRIQEPGIVIPLILLLLLLGMGVCIYIILRYLRGPKSSPKQAHKSASTAKTRSPRPAKNLAGPAPGPAAPQPAPAASLIPAAGASTEAPAPEETEVREMLRLLRVGKMGKLVVEVNGVRYHKLQEITEGAIGRQILLAIQELNEFAGRFARLPVPEMQRLTPQAAVETRKESPLSEEQEVFLSQLQENILVEEESDLRQTGFVDYWRRGFSRSERETTLQAVIDEPKTMIDEIEELLQARLSRNPAWETRSIHFRRTEAGDLSIKVDGGEYETIDDVPYPEVVRELKATIKTWEQRQS